MYKYMYTVYIYIIQYVCILLYVHMHVYECQNPALVWVHELPKSEEPPDVPGDVSEDELPPRDDASEGGELGKDWQMDER